MTGQSETKHTPGEVVATPGGFIRAIESDTTICQFWDRCEDDFANAEANAARIALTWNCHDELVAALTAQGLFLETLARRLDGWAEESTSFGWSTHQVSANRSAAEDCRKMASTAFAALAKASA